MRRGFLTRRAWVAAGATVAVVAGLLGGTAAPAVAEPGDVILWGADITTTANGSPVTLIAALDESPCCGQAVAFDWDLDADGSYDDHSGQSVLWNPAGRTPGDYTVAVRAVIEGTTFTKSGVIHVVVPTTSDTFFADLPSGLSVSVGEPVSLLVTLRGLPAGATPTLAWDLDADGEFDDSTATYGAFVSDVPGNHTVRVRVRHDQMAPEDLPAIATTSITVVTRPVAVSTVGLSGTARVGSLLTSSGGGVTPADATRTVEWLRDGVVIGGATLASYRLTNADAGRRISVRVVASRAGYLTTTSAASRALPVAAVNLVRPSFTGTTRVGRRLTGRIGTWIAPGHTRAYRWLRDGRPITGATRSTYVTTRADRGHRISFRVAVVHSGFPTVRATSVARTITR